MNSMTIDRKQFLRSGAIAASLAASGHLPLLGADAGGPRRAGIDAKTGPYAVKPISGYLPAFSPVQRAPKEAGQYRLTYDILHWGGVNWAAGKPTIGVVGQVIIKRERAADAATFEIRQRTKIGGVDNHIEAEIQCAGDELASVEKWTCRSFSSKPNGDVDAISKLNETGACRNGRIEIDGGGYRYEFQATNPVLTQWTVFDYLIAKANPASAERLDFLQDLALLKTGHSLVYDGEIEVEANGGNKIALQTYAQTGEGILPIHYLLDSERRPQLITGSILSWALTDVGS